MKFHVDQVGPTHDLDSSLKDPSILAMRYDPEMAILGHSVLTVSALAHLHKDQIGQNSIIFVCILDQTYPQMVVVRIVDQTGKYCESVCIIYMTF
jgi:hypothetical protein